MTYQTIAVGVVLGLAIYNIAAGILGFAITKYHMYKWNNWFDNMDWLDYDEPVKSTRKKK